MPKLTVLLGRKTIQVHDIDKSVIRIGREEEMDIIIDNPSVSRRHAEFRQDGEGWVVEDLGSSNGTFMDGNKIEAPCAVDVGGEVGMGKFSIVFGKVLGEGADTAVSHSATPVNGFGGTTQINPAEVQELLKDSEKRRRAQVEWESGGRRGTHYFSDAPAVVLGTHELADVRVPDAPKHHVLIFHREEGCEIRNLSGWTKMKVGGGARKKHTLSSGESAVIGGLKVTFIADMG
jgi:pSer/pThr/pTyr-binding forkhead associated (FHA) protein